MWSGLLIIINNRQGGRKCVNERRFPPLMPRTFRSRDHLPGNYTEIQQPAAIVSQGLIKSTLKPFAAHDFHEHYQVSHHRQNVQAGSIYIQRFETAPGKLNDCPVLGGCSVCHCVFQ